MISIIAAIDEKNGLGKNNNLLFKIPADFKRLKALTTGHPIIMGRKTFDSIGHALPNRTNIVVTSDKNFHFDGVEVCRSLEEGIKLAKEKVTLLRQGFGGQGEVFLFGGGQIFKEGVEKGLVDRLYLTVVKGDYDADVFFPDYSMFTKVLKQEDHEEDGYKFTFLDLEK